MLGLDPEQVGALAVSQGVTGFASKHGGFLLANIDGMGRGYDLHALFTPEGWGREVNAGLKYLLLGVFRTAHYITVSELEQMPSSRPPLSFGFHPCSIGWLDSPHGPMRTWILTLDSWRASPAFRRARCLLHS